ncbi:DNA-protecting protein DprA [Candidatus Falkowbacteria bacterium]|nr:DNA-protecting protein DprA [Candidatus Falkowbacteria bacterium]
MPSDLIFWNAIAKINKIGPKRFKKLYNHFPTMEAAFHASHTELLQAQIEEKIASEFILKRSEINPEKEAEILEKENIKIITVKNDNYPRLLAEIYTPPALLYYKGQISSNEEFPIAVVGTRKFTSYGKQVTEEITRELAKNGITVVSGLALGIDALAHNATLDVNGRTIAVLGSSIDFSNIYPAHNRYLSQKIIDSGGLVLSEYPIGTLPLKQNFPARNRIVSGLSLGTLVIEAPEASGALITARHALDQNREVFAVPGNINARTSIGPNNLIKMGAKAITCASDILETLDLTQATDFIENQKIVPDSPEEEALLPLLSREPVHIDELTRSSKLPVSSITSTLTMMEMKGKVKNLGHMNYVLAR